MKRPPFSLSPESLALQVEGGLEGGQGLCPGERTTPGRTSREADGAQHCPPAPREPVLLLLP